MEQVNEAMDYKAKLERFELGQQELGLIERYVELLVNENEKYNLTAIRDRKEILEKHFYDSLQLLEFMREADIASLIDVGTGAGFPGLALAIVRSDLKIFLIESIAKKVHFLNKVREELELDNVEVICSRIEDLYEGEGARLKADLVTGRAVAYLPVLLELVYGLVNRGGYIAAYKSRGSLKEELSDAKDVIQRYNLDLVKRYEYTIQEDNRTILIYQKIDEVTPFRPRPVNRLKKLYKRG